LLQQSHLASNAFFQSRKSALPWLYLRSAAHGRHAEKAPPLPLTLLMRAHAHLKLIVCEPRSAHEALPSVPSVRNEKPDRVSMIQPVAARLELNELRPRAAMLAVCLVSAVLLCLAFKP
jgi:hypothetical protein